MATQEEPALAHNALQRIVPKHWLIDLRTEGLGETPYDELLSPIFWVEAKEAVRLGDIVTLICGDASTLDIGIGSPDRNGGLCVYDLAAQGYTVPPHPDLAAELAAAESPTEAFWGDVPHGFRTAFLRPEWAKMGA